MSTSTVSLTRGLSVEKRQIVLLGMILIAAVRICRSKNGFATWITAAILRKFDSLHAQNIKIVD